MSGSTIVAGAPGYSQGDGGVFIYDASGTQNGSAHAPNNSNDSLGTSVAISGSTVVAGAPGVNGGDGGVFIYDASGTQSGRPPARTIRTIRWGRAWRSPARR